MVVPFNFSILLGMVGRRRVVIYVRDTTNILEDLRREELAIVGFEFLRRTIVEKPEYASSVVKCWASPSK